MNCINLDANSKATLLVSKEDDTAHVQGNTRKNTVTAAADENLSSRLNKFGRFCIASRNTRSTSSVKDSSSRQEDDVVIADADVSPEEKEEEEEEEEQEREKIFQRVSIFEKNESLLLFVVSREEEEKSKEEKRTNINASAKVLLHEVFEHLLRSRIVAIVRSFVSFSSRNVLSFSLHRQLAFNVSNEISHRPSRIFFSSSSFATRAAAAQKTRRCHHSSLCVCIYISARFFV